VYIQTKDESSIWAEQVKVRGWKLFTEEVKTALAKALRVIAGETDKN
jgi:hypothetical protein